MTTTEPRLRLDVFVAGRPAPQGSKRYVGNGISIESSKAVKPWRADIRDTINQACTRETSSLAPFTVQLHFVMPRPASTPKRRTPKATKKPDIDKLARAVLDAISSAGVWRDDSQVIRLECSKRLAYIDEKPGVWIYITEVEA